MPTADDSWGSDHPAKIMPKLLPSAAKGQHSKLNLNGKQRYTNTFMNALRDFIEPDEVQAEEDRSQSAVEELARHNNQAESEPVVKPQDSQPEETEAPRRYSNQFMRDIFRLMDLNFEDETASSAQTRQQPVPKPQVELQYDDDQQYRPANKAGHKKYSTRFLKSVGMSLTYENEQEDLSSLLSARSVFPWDLGWLSRRDRTMSQGSNGSLPEPITPIELKTVENPWRPELETEKEKDITRGKLSSDRLVKMFRGYLNKITPQNSDTIIDQIKMLPLDPADAKNLANLIFEKAAKEPRYCKLYAQVCQLVSPSVQECVVNTSLYFLQRTSVYEGLNVELRNLAIMRELSPDRARQLTNILHEEMRQRRAKFLNIIKLIGELFKLDLVRIEIILGYFSKLLGERTNESIEFLCGLLRIIGIVTRSNHILASVVRSVLQKLQLHYRVSQEERYLSTRVRFIILDTIDLSERGWKPHQILDEEPKTIAEIRREFEATKVGDTLRTAQHTVAF